MDRYADDDGYSDWLYKQIKDKYIERLREKVANLESINASLRGECGECGYPLEEVRPGSHQCPYCDATAEVTRLTAEVERLREEE